MRQKLEITKQWLEDQNIRVAGPFVYHKSISGKETKLTPRKVTVNHKYGKTMTYYQIAWWNNDDKKIHAMLLHRIIYAWYSGIAHANMVIDHINGNTLDNCISNLREITQAENLKLRNGNGYNQYVHDGLGTSEEIKQLKELTSEASKIKKEAIAENKKLRQRQKEVEAIIAKNKKSYWKQLKEFKAKLIASDLPIKNQKTQYQMKKIELNYIYKEDMSRYAEELDIIKETIHNNVMEYEKASNKSKSMRNELLAKAK